MYVDDEFEDGEVWSDSDNEDERDECDRIESPPGSQHGTSPECPVETSSSALVRWLLAFFLLLQAQFHLADSLKSHFRFF